MTLNVFDPCCGEDVSYLYPPSPHSLAALLHGGLFDRIAPHFLLVTTSMHIYISDITCESMFGFGLVPLLVPLLLFCFWFLVFFLWFFIICLSGLYPYVNVCGSFDVVRFFGFRIHFGAINFFLFLVANRARTQRRLINTYLNVCRRVRRKSARLTLLAPNNFV